MSYTKYIPLLLLVVCGCTATSTRDTVSGKVPANDTQSLSANDETELYRQAITALNSSQLEQAESGFKRIIKNRPEFSGPWVNLALIELRRNNIEGAEKNIAKALERNPKMPQAFNVLGSVEMSKGNINKAVGHYRQAISLKEDYAIAHYNLALLNDIYLQDAKVAVQHYKRYLTLTNNQDKKTAEWVIELERNLSKGSQ